MVVQAAELAQLDIDIVVQAIVELAIEQDIVGLDTVVLHIAGSDIEVLLDIDTVVSGIDTAVWGIDIAEQSIGTVVLDIAGIADIDVLSFWLFNIKIR